MLVPILEDIAGWEPERIRACFEDAGLVLQEWDRVRTDVVSIRDADPDDARAGGARQPGLAGWPRA